MRIGTWLASAILGVATAVALTLPAGPVMALTLVRDAEIEATMRRMADPLIRSALLTPASVRLYLVQDPTPNAFVAGGQNIFLHTGLVTELDGPDQLRAVIAHELGHIAGGHQTRRDEALQGARGIAAIGMLGAAAAAVSGTPEAKSPSRRARDRSRTAACSPTAGPRRRAPIRRGSAFLPAPAAIRRR